MWLLELVGNRTVLGGIMERKAGYRAIVIGTRMETIATDTPLSIIPQKTFSDVPQTDGLVVIDGGSDALAALDDATLLAYVRRAGEQAAWVAATSSGSLLLAAVCSPGG